MEIFNKYGIEPEENVGRIKLGFYKTNKYFYIRHMYRGK